MSKKTWVFMRKPDGVVLPTGKWDVTSSSTQAGSITVPGNVLEVSLYDPSEFGGSPSTLTVASIENVLSSLGITLSDNTLTYFGFNKPGTNKGYLVVAFKATSAITLSFSGGPQASGGTQGVLANQSTVSAPNTDFGGFTGAFSIASGDTLVVIFGGYEYIEGFNLTISRVAGAANFNVSYLSFDGNNYTSVVSASAATISGLSAVEWQSL